jgi:hypothetical protein
VNSCNVIILALNSVVRILFLLQLSALQDGTRYWWGLLDTPYITDTGWDYAAELHSCYVHANQLEHAFSNIVSSLELLAEDSVIAFIPQLVDSGGEQEASYDMLDVCLLEVCCSSPLKQILPGSAWPVNVCPSIYRLPYCLRSLAGKEQMLMRFGMGSTEAT